jgi:hypothetical protein
MRRTVAGLVAAACLLASAGCGAKAHQGGARQVDREWVDNTAGIIDQLQRDLVLGSAQGDSLAAAREALRSGLYTLLVAYTDFGGCRHMVASAGVAPERFAKVTRPLRVACSRLERAAGLFTRAASDDDAPALVEAEHLATSAAPLLVRAREELQAAATTR